MDPCVLNEMIPNVQAMLKYETIKEHEPEKEPGHVLVQSDLVLKWPLP